MARKRVNVTTMLMEQAQVNKISVADIVPSHGEEVLLDVATGNLRITRSTGSRVSEVYDLLFLLRFPKLSEALIEAFMRHALNLRSTTRVTFARQLRRGFFAFLSEQNALHIELFQLDGVLWSAFCTWLDKPKNGSEPWTPLSRRLHLYAAISLFESMATIPRWAKEGKRIAADAPRGAYPGAERKIVPRRRLEVDHLIEIKEAAESEVRAIVERFDEADRILAEGDAELALGNADFRKCFAVCFAALVRRYPAAIPSKSELKADLLSEGAIGSRLYYAARDHTFKRFHDYRYALSDDLVPFALLISIITAMNPEQVLTLKLNEVSQKEFLGSTFLKIDAFKPRARNIQTGLLAAGDISEIGPLYLFHHLRRITERIRPIAGAYADNWFVFRQATKESKAVGFGGKQLSATEGAFSQALERFCRKYAIPKFGLAQIRPTIGDEYRKRFGAFAAARILGHASVDTMDRSYTSDGTRKELQINIGEVQALHGRWMQSKGIIDPRSNSRAHLDKGAATPGFSCADPYSCPLPAHKGHVGLCKAYGECPICPLAQVHLDDPLAAALYVGLREAIYAAVVGCVDPSAWHQKWAPVVQAVDNIISSIPLSVMSRRPKLPFPLPPVG